MKHYIEINEQHRKVFAVEADSEEDAISRVEAAYDSGSITVSDSEMVFLAYNAVRNRQEIEQLQNSGTFTVLPDRPVMYIAEYTLTIRISETESRDICCKTYDYKSIDEAKDDSPSVIADMLYDHKIPDGTYTLDARYYYAAGEEDPVYMEGVLIKVLYQDGRILLEEKCFKKGKVK